jgi:SWI/SNF-related matrix-associated actin-dependent regulator 1 of chromatin subfamily A
MAKLSVKKIGESYDLLKEYNGKNTYIVWLKNEVYAYKRMQLSEFHSDYILRNYDKDPIFINKIGKIADWYGIKKQEDWKTDFVPEKLLLKWYMGETENLYHFYVQYRQSQKEDVQLFIPKSALLTDVFAEPFENKVIDFEKWEKLSGIKLKPHQETAVKFLTTRKKAILAMEMGSGKTFSSIVAALEDDFKKILVICPASLKTNWKRELMTYVSEDEIVIVEGSKWKENKFTIINFDILDNFYTVPTEIMDQKVKDFDDDGNVVWKTKKVEKVSRKKDVIEKSMLESQLFQMNFDLIIIDEVHKLSNSTSGRYKIVSDLIKRTNPQGLYLMSGTPITNNPKNAFNILRLLDHYVTRNYTDYVMRYCDGKQFFDKTQRNKLTSIFLKQRGKSTWFQLSNEQKTELDQYLEANCRKITVDKGASNLDELAERIKTVYFRVMTEEIGNFVKKTVNVIRYDLNKEEKAEYKKVWDNYEEKMMEIDGNSKVSENKQLIETTILRQWLSVAMLPRTIKMIDEFIEQGHKVVVATCYDEELYTLQEHYGDSCVIYNGKMTAKKKDKNQERFLNDPTCKVFVGNINSAGVGLSLVSSDVLVFNSFDWVPGQNTQFESRVHRLTSANDVNIYYQILNNTMSAEMFDKVIGKEMVISQIIKKEEEK